MQTADFFRARLDEMIDLRHPLAVLATRLPWVELENALSPIWQRECRDGVVCDGGTLLPEAGGIKQGTGVSTAGRPRLSIRLMCALLYLKHSFNLSDEALVERWSENVVWQYFSGMEYYEPRLPCDATQIGRFRRAIGETGMQALLKATIDTAIASKALKPVELERVIVDTTVQEKAISYPVDARLLEIARHKLVSHAKRCGIGLRQTFAKEGASLRRKAAGYAHAKQFKRLARTLKRQRTIVGKLIREIRRKLVWDAASGAVQGNGGSSTSTNTSTSTHASSDMIANTSTNTSTKAAHLALLDTLLERAERIRTQKKGDKNKLYALHAPEVECISKGKARNRYEFGVKVSLAITHAQGLIVGAKRFAGNPYDGHTLSAQIAQSNTLIASHERRIKQAVVDLGYRGVDTDNPSIEVVHRGRIKSMCKVQRQQLQRRQAIEPVIGHVKEDHRMDRCHLKGSTGDALHAIACATGYNIRWLMRAILRLGLTGLFALFAWLRPSLAISLATPAPPRKPPSPSFSPVQFSNLLVI